MQVGKLFDLITDTRDVLEYFDGVDNRDQLVSRLERLKRQGTDDLYACIEGLRVSLTAMLADTLEMSASPGAGEEDSDEVSEQDSAAADENLDENELDRQLEEIGKAWLEDEKSEPQAASSATAEAPIEPPAE
jgi:hypothetical protein